MSAWLRTVALSFVRSGRHARRTPALAFVFPVVPALAMVAVYASLLSRMGDLPGFPTASYIDWMTAGALVVVPMTGAAFSGMALATDIQSGYLERIRLLPVNPIAFLIGRVLFDGVRMLPAAVAVLAVAAALGADFASEPVGWLLLPLIVVLWTIAYNSLFLLIAARTRSPEAVQAAFPIFAPLTFLSSVWFPTQLMPRWAETISGFNPVTGVTDGVRNVVTEGVATGPVLTAIVLALVLTAALQTLTARSLVTTLRGG